MATFENIRLICDGSVAIVTLHRPSSLNALNSGLLEELYSLVSDLDEDDDISVIILTGSGDRAFSAGADIKEMARFQREGKQPPSHHYTEAMYRLSTSRKPTIGAINGIAFGGAAALASALDIRVGCDRTQFRYLAVTYGRLNATWQLPNLVGLPVARELLYTGRIVDAQEAQRIGLLNWLVADDKVLSKSVEIAQMIAQNDQRMVQGAKKLLNEGIGTSLRVTFEAEMNAIRGPLSPVPVTEGFSDFIGRKGIG